MCTCLPFLSLRDAPKANTTGDGLRPTKPVSDGQKCRHFVWNHAYISETSECTGVAVPERYTPRGLLDAISTIDLQAVARYALAQYESDAEYDEDTGRHFLWSPGSEAAVALAVSADERTRNQKDVQAYSMCTPRNDGNKTHPSCTQRIPTQSTCDELPDVAEGAEEDDSDTESSDDDKDDWLQGFSDWLESFPEREEESTALCEHDDRAAAMEQVQDKADFLHPDWSGEVSSLPVSMRRQIFERNRESARSAQGPAFLKMPQALQKACTMKQHMPMATNQNGSSGDDIATVD